LDNKEQIDQQIKQLQERQSKVSHEIGRLIDERDQMTESLHTIKYVLLFVLISGPIIMIGLLVLLFYFLP